MRKTYKLVKQEIEKSKRQQEAENIPNIKGELNFQVGDCVYVKNETKLEGKKLSNRYAGPYRIIKKYDNDVTFKLLKPQTGKTYKTHVSRIKRAKFTETWTPQPLTSNTSEDKNEPPRSRLSELKPFNFKQGYFENSSDEEKFNEFLTMTNMVTPPPKVPPLRGDGGIAIHLPVKSQKNWTIRFLHKRNFFRIEFRHLFHQNISPTIWYTLSHQ